MEWLLDQLTQTFITDNRWRYFVSGIAATLEVTVLALVLGTIIGVLVAVARSAHDSQRGNQKGLGHIVLGVLDWLCKLYLTVIRGTPSTVQLLIMWFIVFQWAGSDSMLWVASLSFGINSGAYVAEIVRSGIMSIDLGQT